jgi:hypothetical protein
VTAGLTCTSLALEALMLRAECASRALVLPADALIQTMRSLTTARASSAARGASVHVLQVLVLPLEACKPRSCSYLTSLLLPREVRC